jgi:hypothetical protein
VVKPSRRRPRAINSRGPRSSHTFSGVSGHNYQYNQPGYFPNSTVVPLSNQTEGALTGIENRATQGSDINRASQENILGTLRGDHLDVTNNPAFQKASQGIQSQVGGMFSAAGRYGSGGMANQAREALTDLGAKTYAAERGNQMQALSLAPSIANQDYFDLQQLQGVGAAREQQAGAQLQDEINRWNYQQNAPDEALRRYMTLVGGGTYGGSSSGTQPIYSNNLASGLGAAAALASIYKAFQ